jgi:hypothetical protein
MSVTHDPVVAPPHGAGKQDEVLLTPKEAAKFLRLSESYLAKARMRGDGPRYRKLSSRALLNGDTLLSRLIDKGRRVRCS